MYYVLCGDSKSMTSTVRCTECLCGLRHPNPARCIKYAMRYTGEKQGTGGRTDHASAGLCLEAVHIIKCAVTEYEVHSTAAHGAPQAACSEGT